jgi:hypothetical protein
LIIAPFAIFIFCSRPFLGEKKAISRAGKCLTLATASFMNLLVPKISSPSEYGPFKKKLEKRFRRLCPFYDLEIVRSTDRVFESRVRHCPVTGALKTLGLPELCKYACAGDWQVAEKNGGNWTFSRRHTLGTDCLPCNHTYISKAEQ